MEAPEEAVSLRLSSRDGDSSDGDKPKKKGKPGRWFSLVCGGLWCLPILVLGLLGPVSWLLTIYFSIDIALASSLVEQPLESASLGCNTLAQEAQRLGVTNLLWQGSCNNFDGIRDILDKSAYVDLITLLTMLIARQQDVKNWIASTFAQDTGCYDLTSKSMYYILSVVIFLLAIFVPRSFGSNSHSGKEAKMYRPIKEIATRFAFDRRLNNTNKDPEMRKDPNSWKAIFKRAKFWDSANRPENFAVLDSWDDKWRYIRDKMKPARSLALGGQKFASSDLQALLELTKNEDTETKPAAGDSSRHSDSDSPKRSLELSLIPEAEKRVREAEDLMSEKMANVEGAFNAHKMSLSHSFGRAVSQSRADSELAAVIEEARDAARALAEAEDHLNQLRANQRENANCTKRNGGGGGTHNDRSMIVMEAMIEKASDNDHQWTFYRWISGTTDGDGRADGKEADEDQKILRKSAESYVKNRIDRWAKWSLFFWIICWLAMSAHLVFLIFIPAIDDSGIIRRRLSDTTDTNHACVRLSTILENNTIAFGGACMDTRSLGEVLGVLETTANIQHELSRVDSILYAYVFNGDAWSRFRQQSRVCTPQLQSGKGFVKSILGSNFLRAFSLPTIVFPSFFTFAYAPVTQRYIIPRRVYIILGELRDLLILWYQRGISQGSKVLPIIKALGTWGNAVLFFLVAVGVTVIALAVKYLPTLLGDLEAISPGTPTVPPTLSTFAPTNSPTQAPTPLPVLSPTFVPTLQPTASPSTSPVASEDMHLTGGAIAGATVAGILFLCFVIAACMRSGSGKSGSGDAGTPYLPKSRKCAAKGLLGLVYFVVGTPFLLIVGIGALPIVLLALSGYIVYNGAKGLKSGGGSLWRRAKFVGAYFWTKFIRPRLPDACELCDLEFNRYRRWYKCQDHYCEKHHYRHGTLQTPSCPKCDDETVELCDCTKKLNRPPLRECEVCFCITHDVRKTESSSRALCGEPDKVCRICDCPNHKKSRKEECVNCFCLQHDKPLTETRDGERGCEKCFCEKHPNIKLVIKDGDAENKEHCSKCDCTHGRIRETCKKCWCPKHGAKVDLWCASCEEAHRIDDLAWARGCRMPHECLSCLKGCQPCRESGVPESDVPWRESCPRHWCGKHRRSEIPREDFAENEKCSVCHDPCEACNGNVPNESLPARQECDKHWCTEHGRSMCVICSGEELVCPYCLDETGVYKTRNECNEECNDHWCHDEQHRDSYHDELKDGDIESRGDHVTVDAVGFVKLTQFSRRCPVCTDPCRECSYEKKRVRTSCNDHFCVDVHKNPKVLLGGEWRCERCDDPCLRCQELGEVPPLRTQCELHFCQVHERTVEKDSSDRKCIVCTDPCCHAKENQVRTECEQCYCKRHERFLCEFLDSCAGGFCSDCNCVYCKAPLNRGNPKIRDADRFDTDRCTNCEGFCHHVKDPRTCKFCWCFSHNKARLIEKTDEDLIDGHYRPCPKCKPCEHAVYCREACDECFCQKHEIYKIARYSTQPCLTKPDASQKRFCPSCGEIPGPLTRKRFCKFTAKLFNCRQMDEGSTKRYTWIDILDHVTADRQSPSTSIWTQGGVRNDQNFEEIFEAIRAAQLEIGSFVDNPPGVQTSRMWLVYNPGSPDMRLDQGEARRSQQQEEGLGDEATRKLVIQELFHICGSQWVKNGEELIRHDPAADILFASDYREIASYGSAESKEPRFDYRTVFSSEVLRKRLSEMEFERLQETIDSGPHAFFEKSNVKIQEEKDGHDAEGREDLYSRLIERSNEETRERHD